MKNNFPMYTIFKPKKQHKRRGFTLVETIIAFALIGILSGGIYSAYLFLIRTTDSADKRQSTTIYGKKLVEEIKGNILDKEFTIVNDKISLNNNIQLAKSSDSYSRTQYLDLDYNVCDEASSKYKEIIALKNTKAKKQNGMLEDINLDASTSNSDEGISKHAETFEYNLSVERVENGKIQIKSDEVKNDDSGENPSTLLAFNSDSNIAKINAYVNSSELNGNIQKNIIIKNESGKTLLTRSIKNISENNKQNQIILNINFNDYKLESGSTQHLKDIEVNVFNEDIQPVNICLRKSENINANVKIRSGVVRVYNNRSEDEEKSKIGNLYDIEVVIYKKDSPNKWLEVFKGYCNQNIKIMH